ncbi:MAG: helix-turn-helix domain-containing protein [Oscillospiraceae bacterium]|jgi:putative transcriptional regulator|nr:helix-turn-helix domain-containing protein [Oscillospiraceae bacterium]
MIKYHPHLLSMLTDAGYSQKDMRKYKLISQSSLQSIREGKPLSLSTINVICNLLDCQPGDILRFELTEDDRRFLEDKLRIYYDYGDQPADKS